MSRLEYDYLINVSAQTCVGRRLIRTVKSPNCIRFSAVSKMYQESDVALKSKDNLFESSISDLKKKPFLTDAGIERFGE